jgi:prolyl oligopeptidase
MKRCGVALLGALGLSAIALSTAWALSIEPPTPLAPQPVEDTFYGQRVVDPFRFLERTEDPRVAKWMRAQADYARAILDTLPERDKLLERVQRYDDAAPARVSAVRRRVGLYFYLKRSRTDDQFKLYMRRIARKSAGQEILLVDPEAIAKAKKQPHAINYYEPSYSGRYVAYGMSAGGSEDAALYVLDTKTRKTILGPITRAQYGGVQWLEDDSGFFFNRLQPMRAGMPATDKYQKSRALLMRLGTDLERAPSVLAYDTPGVEIDPEVEAPYVGPIPGTSYAAGVVQHGTDRELTLYVAPLASVLRGEPQWRKVFDRADQVTSFEVVGDRLFLLTHRSAPRSRVLETSLEQPDFGTARVVMAEARGPTGGVIEALVRARDALYIKRRDGALSRLYRLPLEPLGTRVNARMYEAKIAEVRLPMNGSLAMEGIDHRLPGVVLELQAWTRARQLLLVDAKGATNTGLQPAGPYDALPDYVATEVLVTSHDGAKVPLSIVHRRDIKLDGNNPTLLYGYAAYGDTEEPWFSPWRLAWLERGGVFAVANPRGSGAFGEDWYRAGQLANKPNTWQDFIACAEYLIAQKYAAPQRLGIWGGSAGGILVGRAMTTRPDLFAAVISSVGVNDTVRAELSPNGVPNVPEFGSVKTEAGFKALYAMSTYHHVASGTRYPAVLLTHGVNDPRVDVWQSTKLAAALLAANPSGRAVLLRLDYQAGHGLGDTKQQVRAEYADVMAFLLWQFGATGQTVAR